MHSPPTTPIPLRSSRPFFLRAAGGSTDYISLSVLGSAIPIDRIDAVLTATGKTSLRQRDLPAHVVVYYVVALALFMQSSYREVLRCLLEGLDWLRGPSKGIEERSPNTPSSNNALRKSNVATPGVFALWMEMES